MSDGNKTPDQFPAPHLALLFGHNSDSCEVRVGPEALPLSKSVLEEEDRRNRTRSGLPSIECGAAVAELGSSEQVQAVHNELHRVSSCVDGNSHSVDSEEFPVIGGLSGTDLFFVASMTNKTSGFSNCDTLGTENAKSIRDVDSTANFQIQAAQLDHFLFDADEESLSPRTLERNCTEANCVPTSHAEKTGYEPKKLCSLRCRDTCYITISI